MHSWLKLLWEKVDLFQLHIELKVLLLQLPQFNDKWIMRIFVAGNYRREELIRLNRVRCYQQVIFLSDIMDASGRTIEQKYLKRRPAQE
jgi:hypothetical protein